jgi:hypothetical protein
MARDSRTPEARVLTGGLVAWIGVRRFLGACGAHVPLAGHQMHQGPGLSAVVQLAGANKPGDLAAAKKEAANLTPENAADETLSDGFAYTFENKGSMGTNYWVMVRRTIGDKPIWCESTALDADARKVALEACKSHRPG